LITLLITAETKLTLNFLDFFTARYGLLKPRDRLKQRPRESKGNVVNHKIAV